MEATTTTPAGDAAGMKTPSLPRRAAAWLMDQALIVGVAGVTYMPFLLRRIGVEYEEPLRDQLRSYAVFLLPQVAGFLYFAVVHGVWGTSLGKRLLQLRVARLDGGRIHGGKAVFRAFWSSGFFALPLIGLAIAPGVFKLGMLAALLYGLADAIAALSNAEGRALHDIFVNTMVIEAGKPAAVST